MGLVLEKSATAYGLGTPGSFVAHSGSCPERCASNTRLPSISTSTRNVSPLSLTWAVRSKLVAALSKFLPSPFRRQAISRTPRLIVLSTVSSHWSSGVVVPSFGEYHRRLQSCTRPLIVSTVKSCRPLLRLVLPVVGSFGGGKEASASLIRICTPFS